MPYDTVRLIIAKRLLDLIGEASGSELRGTMRARRRLRQVENNPEEQMLVLVVLVRVSRSPRFSA